MSQNGVLVVGSGFTDKSCVSLSASEVTAVQKATVYLSLYGTVLKVNELVFYDHNSPSVMSVNRACDTMYNGAFWWYDASRGE